MSEWKEVVIGNHLDLISGYAFKSVDFLSQQVASTLPVIKIKNVANGDVNFNDVVFHKYNENLEKFLLSKGDVLIAMTGNHPQSETQVVGDVSRYKLNEKALLNQRVGKLIVKDDTNLDFIYYLFKNDDVRFFLANQASGSANQANISKGDILGLNLTIPQQPEQTAIASILTSLDDKIDLLHRQNATLEKMAETLFKQWFVVEAKEDWEEVWLKDFISIKHGYAFKGQFITSEPTNLILVTPGNFKIGGGFKFDKFKYYTNQEFPEDYIFNTGDLIVTMTDLSVEGATLGYPAFVPKPYSNDLYLHNQRVGKVEFKKDIGKNFLYQLMKTEDYQWFVLGGASGTAIRHTSPTSICNYSFKMPSESRIQEFENITDRLEKKKESNQTQIRTLTALRDTLLPKLMSGEVRVEM
jgi:type I restriction enzyme S subunit